MRTDCDVLVVGAGPVGLFAAVALATRQLRVQVLDERHTSLPGARTFLLHARTLELLDETGLLDAVLEHGRRIERIELYEAERYAGCLDLSTVARRFPFVVSIEASAFEIALLRRLSELGIEPQRGFAVTSVSQSASHVGLRLLRRELVAPGDGDSRLESRDAEVSEKSALFVIGADGYASKVRGELGIAWGNQQPLQTFVIGEFDAVAGRKSEAAIVFEPNAVSAFFVLPQAVHLAFQVSTGLNREPTEAVLRELLQQRLPWLQIELGALRWAQLTHFERMLAGAFGKGRIWLAGDAAHVTGPIGMQSVNGGLYEACELARCMSRVVTGRAKQDAFVAFERQRCLEWSVLLGIDQRVRSQAHAGSWLPENAARVVACIPAAGCDLNALLHDAGLELTEPRGPA